MIFLPDRYLASYVARRTEKEIISWPGSCEVHEKFTPEEIGRFRDAVPGLKVIAHPEWLDYLRGYDQWRNLKCVVKIQSNRHVKGKRSPECRYYICSRIASAADLLAAARSHWGVENNVHWVLDAIPFK